MKRILIAVMMVAAIGAHAQEMHGDWHTTVDTDAMTDETTAIAFTRAARDSAAFFVIDRDVLVQAAHVINHDSSVTIRVDDNPAREYQAGVSRDSAMPLDYDINELRGAERILVRVSTVRGQATYEFSGDGIDEAFKAHGW